jgi:hypothetical protein
MEHRWGIRVAVHLPIRLRPMRSALAGIGRMTDLSLSGGFIADFDSRLLSRIQLIFDSPLGLRSGILLAYVARVDAQGIGIEWCEFAPRPVKELLRALKIPPEGFAGQGIQTLAMPIRSMAAS